MEFNEDVVVIIGHNGSTIWEGEYFLFFGGLELAEEYNGTIVKEEDVEMAINHEVLHCVIDSLGEDAECLDHIWYMYTDPIPLLSGCAHMGLGYN